jgi:hypothetical protein
MARAHNEYPLRAEHSIGPRRFGSFTFEISSDHAEMARYAGDLFGAFERAENDDAVVHTVVILTKTEDDQQRMVIDGELAATEPIAGRIAGTLVHTLTRRMINEADALGLHAGGVARHGTAVALPAVMESGKSTLTAGLVRAGFSYLTDEAVFLDWETRRVIPFPKPISLDPGSWPLFPELEPNAPLPDGYKDDQWHIPPDAIRPGAVGPPCRVRHVVFPRYAERASTRLTPLRRAEATIELARNTFRFNERPRRSLDMLAAAAPEAECYRLDIGDLDDAVALVSELVESRR